MRPNDCTPTIKIIGSQPGIPRVFGIVNAEIFIEGTIVRSLKTHLYRATVEVETLNGSPLTFSATNKNEAAAIWGVVSFVQDYILSVVKEGRPVFVNAWLEEMQTTKGSLFHEPKN